MSRALLLVLGTLSLVPAADWPGFRGPGQSGVSPETGFATTWADTSPTVAWTVPLAAGYGGAAIVGDRVFVMDREVGRKDHLRCLRVSDGSELWHHAWDSPGRGTWGGSACVPAVADGAVVAVGLNGLAVCCDAATGEERWRLDLTGYGEDRHRLLSSGRAWQWHDNPVIHDGMVLLMGYVADAGLVAIDLETGEERWRSSFVGYGNFCHATPRIMEIGSTPQAVVQGNLDRQRDPPAVISGVSLADGRILWQFETARALNVPVGMPVPTGRDSFLLSAGYRFGTAAWRVTAHKVGPWQVTPLFGNNQACNAYLHTPLVVEGHLYAQSFDDFHQGEQHGVVCLTPAGRRLWRSADTGFTGEGVAIEPTEVDDLRILFGYGGMIAADGHLYAVDGRSGEVFLIPADPQAFRVTGRFKPFGDARDKCWAEPALAGGALYLRSVTTLAKVVLPKAK